MQHVHFLDEMQQDQTGYCESELQHKGMKPIISMNNKRELHEVELVVLACDFFIIYEMHKYKDKEEMAYKR